MIKRLIFSAAAALLMILSGCFYAAGKPQPGAPSSTTGAENTGIIDEHTGDERQGEPDSGGENGGENGQPAKEGELPQKSLSQIIVLPTLISGTPFTQYNYKYSDDGESLYICSFSFIITENRIKTDKDFTEVFAAGFKDKSLYLNRQFVMDAGSFNFKFNAGCEYFLSVKLKNYVLKMDNGCYGECGNAVFNLNFTLSGEEITFSDITADGVLDGFLSGGIKYNLKLIFI